MLVKERIKYCFNTAMHTYEDAAWVQRTVAEKLVKRLPKKKNTKTEILEMGCGTGLLSQQLISHFPAGHFLITDYAENMVSTCKQRFQNNDAVEVALQDAEKFSSDKQFDLITSSMTLHWVNDLPACLQELTKYLKPNGELGVAFLGENSLQEWRKLCNQMHITPGTPLFPSLAFLQQHVTEMQFEKENYAHEYSSLYAFLKSLKNLGAHAARGDYLPFSSGKLRQLLRSHDHKIKINYEIIYGRFIKK